MFKDDEIVYHIDLEIIPIIDKYGYFESEYEMYISSGKYEAVSKLNLNKKLIGKNPKEAWNNFKLLRREIKETSDKIVYEKFGTKFY